MAFASQKTPLQQPKAPEKVVYQLLKKNEKLRPDTPDYKPLIIMKNTSLVSIEGELVNLRYIKGHKSVFVHEQEEGNRPLPENLTNSKKNEIHIVDGKIEVSPSDSVLIKYLDTCSQNVESKHRVDTIPPLFKRVSEKAVIVQKASYQKDVEKALKMIASADNSQIIFHARHLGVDFIDPLTGASREEEAILTDYKQMAFDDPAKFIFSFNDIDLKVRYWIDRALSENVIDVTSSINKAIWSGSKAEICNVPTGTDMKNIQEALFVFANRPQAGADLLKQLRDKYS